MLAVGACLLLWSGVAMAASSAPAPAISTGLTSVSGSSITTLATVNVTGVVPGPGLWWVRSGTHMMWILGVVPRLPAGIQWHSTEVEGAIAAAQTVLEAPGVKLKVDANWLGKLFLLLPIYRAQRNPDGQTLADVLPAPLYARWEAARQRYFGDDDGIDRYRPILAAVKLFKRAMKRHGLRGNGAVDDTVAALARQYGTKLVKPEATLEIHKPRQALRSFVAYAPDGDACLDLVLDVVKHGLADFRTRANAWAVGDIAALRRAPMSAYRETCEEAITSAGFARSLGIDDLPVRIEGAWMAAADAALAANSRSFAVLPMRELLDPHGYLAALRARGYQVTAPPGGTAPRQRR